MDLTEKQKNCPYCHGGNDHQPIYDSDEITTMKGYAALVDKTEQRIARLLKES